MSLDDVFSLLTIDFNTLYESFILIGYLIWRRIQNFNQTNRRVYLKFKRRCRRPYHQHRHNIVKISSWTKKHKPINQNFPHDCVCKKLYMQLLNRMCAMTMKLTMINDRRNSFRLSESLSRFYLNILKSLGRCICLVSVCLIALYCALLPYYKQANKKFIWNKILKHSYWFLIAAFLLFMSELWQTLNWKQPSGRYRFEFIYSTKTNYKTNISNCKWEISS